MERELVHGEGDVEGEPYRLGAHQLRALYRWFEYEPARDRDGAPLVDQHGRHLPGLYLHSKGLIGWPKGSGKTEFEAGLGLEHLLGPSWKFGTPVVTVAAVDGDQSKELVRIAGLMVADQHAGDLLQVDSGRIQEHAGAGRMLASSAALGKNDGKRSSLLLTDEIHEWDADSERGAERHRILEKNARKRRNGRQLNVTTAGWNLDTLAGRMYRLGCQIAAGEVINPRFLFDWWEASPHWDLNDPDQLIAAIREANPAADVFWPLVNLLDGYVEDRMADQVESFIRYHLNRWMGTVDDVWMAVEDWMACAINAGPPKDATPVVLGFDGSRTMDSTALVGATVSPTPHVFVVGCWERDERANNADPWHVPIEDVERTIEASCRRWDVKSVQFDSYVWQSSMVRLMRAGLPVEEVSQTAKRMAPAAQRLWEGVARRQLTHDGDARMIRHIANCRKGGDNPDYVTVVKEHKHSKKRIDLAIAGIMAHERAADLALVGQGGPNLW